MRLRLVFCVAAALGIGVGWWARDWIEKRESRGDLAAAAPASSRIADLLEGASADGWVDLQDEFFDHLAKHTFSGIAEARSAMPLADRWVEIDAVAAERYARTGQGGIRGRSDRSDALRAAIWTALARRGIGHKPPESPAALQAWFRGKVLADANAALAPDSLRQLPRGWSLAHTVPVAGPRLAPVARRMLAELDGESRESTLTAVFDAWSRHRPEEAFSALAEAPGHTMEKLLLSIVFRNWLNLDPRAAFERSGEIADPKSRFAVRGSILESLIESDGGSAFDWLISHLRGESELRRLLLKHHAQFDPNSAVGFIATLDPKEIDVLRDHLRYARSDRHHHRHFLATLALRNADQAIGLFEELCPENELLADAIGVEVGRTRFEDVGELGAMFSIGRVRDRFLAAAAIERARSHPREAVRFAESCGGKVLASAGRQIAVAWGRIDQMSAIRFAMRHGDERAIVELLTPGRGTGRPEEVLRVLAGDPELLCRLLSLEGFALQFTKRLAGPIALFLSEQMSPGAALASGRFAAYWLRMDQRAAVRWIERDLPEGGVRDAAVRALVDHIKEDDLAEARRLCETISDPEIRERVTNDIGER